MDEFLRFDSDDLLIEPHYLNVAEPEICNEYTDQCESIPEAVLYQCLNDLKRTLGLRPEDWQRARYALLALAVAESRTIRMRREVLQAIDNRLASYEPKATPVSQ